jgi:hypothetical protein
MGVGVMPASDTAVDAAESSASAVPPKAPRLMRAPFGVAPHHVRNDLSLAPAAEYGLTRICRDGYVLVVESAFERHLDSMAPKPQEKGKTR